MNNEDAQLYTQKQLGADWRYLVQTNVVWSNLVQVGANWCNLVKAGATWSKFVQKSLVQLGAD